MLREGDAFGGPEMSATGIFRLASERAIAIRTYCTAFKARTEPVFERVLTRIDRKTHKSHKSVQEIHHEQYHPGLATLGMERVALFATYAA